MRIDNIIENNQKNPAYWKSGKDPNTVSQESSIEMLSAGIKNPNNLYRSEKK